MSEQAFKIEIYSINPSTGEYTKIDEIRNFLGLTFFSQLNGAGTANFTIPGFSDKATNANIKRYSNIIAIKFNETIIWTGFISNFTPSYSAGTQQGEEQGFSLSIECEEFIGHLKSRFTASVVRYTQEDAGDIAMALITYTQGLTNGELGINEGAIEATIDRDREYQRKNIYEAIVDLTQVEDGFDFDLTPIQDANHNLTSHNFNVYAERGQYRPEVAPLVIGGNVLSFSGFTRDPIINHATFKGAGIGEDTIFAEAENTASQVSFTRREAVTARSDISIRDTLEGHANELVNGFKDNILYLSLEIKPNSNVPYGAFAIGDTINVNLGVPEMNIDYEGTGSVVSIEARVDSQAVLFYSTMVKLGI